MNGNDVDRTGLLMCGHGSRDVDAIAEFERMTRAVRARLTGYEVDHGYLEFARPMIRDGLEALKRRGVSRILALPGMGIPWAKTAPLLRRAAWTIRRWCLMP